jgi:hypothetical protein
LSHNKKAKKKNIGMPEQKIMGLTIPWSRNFNYTPHHTYNPLFLHLPFSLAAPAKREQKGGCN